MNSEKNQIVRCIRTLVEESIMRKTGTRLRFSLKDVREAYDYVDRDWVDGDDDWVDGRNLCLFARKVEDRCLANLKRKDINKGSIAAKKAWETRRRNEGGVR